MPALVEIPTQEFKTRSAMILDRAVNEWNKKRYVIIVNDEEFGGGLSFHLFTTVINQAGETESRLILLFAEKGGALASGLPPGGDTGQMLIKNSPVDYDARWADVPVFSGESFALLLKPGTRLLIKPGTKLKI